MQCIKVLFIFINYLSVHAFLLIRIIFIIILLPIIISNEDIRSLATYSMCCYSSGYFLGQKYVSEDQPGSFEEVGR